MEAFIKDTPLSRDSGNCERKWVWTDSAVRRALVWVGASRIDSGGRWLPAQPSQRPRKNGGLRETIIYRYQENSPASGFASAYGGRYLPCTPQHAHHGPRGQA